jgi:hypothetical protein
VPAADVCGVSAVIQECSLCFGSFHKSLVRQDASRCGCQSRMSYLALAEYAASSAAETTTGVCRGIRRYRLVFKRASCFEARICFAETPQLRTVLAQSVHGHYLQDWLTSVSPDNGWTYRTVIAVNGSVVSGPGLAASRRRAIVARPNLSVSALVNRSFDPPHRAAPPDTPITVLCPSAIGKTAAGRRKEGRRIY